MKGPFKQGGQQMEDIQILDLFFARDERAILESNLKYGGYCHGVMRIRTVTASQKYNEI
jgi:hypothetical protein